LETLKKIVSAWERLNKLHIPRHSAVLKTIT